MKIGEIKKWLTCSRGHTEADTDCISCTEHEMWYDEDEDSFMFSHTGVTPGCFWTEPSIYGEKPDDFSDEWYKEIEKEKNGKA